MTLDTWSSCLLCWRAAIVGVCCNTSFKWGWGLSPELWALYQLNHIANPDNKLLRQHSQCQRKRITEEEKRRGQVSTNETIEGGKWMIFKCIITYTSMLKRCSLKKWKNYKFEKSEWGLREAEFSIHWRQYELFDFKITYAHYIKNSLKHLIMPSIL